MKKSDKNIKYSHMEFGNDTSFFFDHVHIVWNEQISIHQSDDWEISYIVSGSGTRIIGNLMESFAEGEVVLIPPKMPHGWYFDEHIHDEEGKIENITIIFPDALLDKCGATFPETRLSIQYIKDIKEGISLKADVLLRVRDSMYSMQYLNDMERLSAMLSIFSAISSAKEIQVVGSYEKRNRNALKLQEVYRYMVNHYNKKITLDEVAGYVGMNSAAFSRFFQKEKGKSFFKTLIEYRINCSCIMLRETSKSVAEICFAVGFNDVPYFNRAFKKNKGVTPNTYRISIIKS